MFFCVSIVSFSSILFSFLDISLLNFFFKLLSSFFKKKKIFFLNINYTFFSIFEGFPLFGWKFFLNKTDFFSGSISYNNIKYHKLRLSKILKSSCFFSFFYVLKLLNKEILLWTSNFSFSDLFICVSFKLDFFIYKLIWKYVKKLHPRRPNTWIYSKYWKLYNNVYKFLLFDSFRGQLLFLISHISFNFSYTNFSVYLNNFDYLNIKRFNLISYNSFSNYLYTVYYYLWKRQFGLCFICCRVFDISKEFNFRLVSLDIKDSLNSRLILVHKYCSFG